jgi:hypothetical protein
MKHIEIRRRSNALPALRGACYRAALGVDALVTSAFLHPTKKALDPSAFFS